MNYVSFYDALRFANWLHNGQPSGPQDSTTTEDGAYTFSGIWTVGERNAGQVEGCGHRCINGRGRDRGCRDRRLVTIPERAVRTAGFEDKRVGVDRRDIKFAVEHGDDFGRRCVE